MLKYIFIDETIKKSLLQILINLLLFIFEREISVRVIYSIY
jgi:hypothetical protein